MSQIPDFHGMEWLSIFSAIMSFTCSIIGSALGLAKVIGDIAFAYPFSIILIEIQDLANAAFGNSAPGNLLTGFGFFKPYWLIDFANMCVAVHLVGAYQVFSQPQFAMVERWAAEKFPSSGFVNDNYILKNIGKWTRKWIALHIYSSICLLVATFALVGSIEGRTNNYKVQLRHIGVPEHRTRGEFSAL
ncbi:hypothetical protein TEA_025307 [Camellia sinensis var. sinensis]|uniref:Amino acid transporter transmembrane domain-containing protein n=1 Tax=Camellia sinensis var. sinensis TaxID=542762 RepID=A0A4S4D0J5_CAMSN|nr:hypothetical protein TEA_025307 [Camellia sinensis var. sinensis]